MKAIIPDTIRPMLYRPRRAAHHCHVVNGSCVLFISMSNVYVLPPGQGRAVGVDVVVFMPVGSDDLFDFFDGSVTRNLRTHPAGNPSGCRAKSWASVPTCGHPTQICASYRGIKAVPGLSPIALAESTTVFPPSQLCLNVDNPQSESSSYVRPP